MKHVGPNRLHVMNNKNNIIHSPKSILQATRYVSLVHLVDPRGVDHLSNSTLEKKICQ